uniref:Uncharacterized protein n=1 Tax=Mastacembelus armatus TaxID=205130 RepID=A0A3Q3LFD2_9TELE
MPLQAFSFPFPETRFFRAGSLIYKFKIRGGSSYRQDKITKPKTTAIEKPGPLEKRLVSIRPTRDTNSYFSGKVNLLKISSLCIFSSTFNTKTQ